jgi:hypothetical protein
MTELLVVIGLIAVFISLLLPAFGRVRAAANGTTCLSNVRQMGTAWSMYLSENRGRLPEYIWSTTAMPDRAWRAYWPGILDSYGVRGETLLCPSAQEPIPFSQSPLHRGFGNLSYAWSGKFLSNGTAVRFNATTYRASSYGYNRYLTAYNVDEPVLSGGFGPDGKATRMNAIRRPGDVPVFLDAVAPDFAPSNGSPDAPAAAPPNLRWDNIPPPAPDHWKFLIARHGHAINGYFADGSAKRIVLEETYKLSWRGNWTPYRLPLPSF